jgi:hypothetical protein
MRVSTVVGIASGATLLACVAARSSAAIFVHSRLMHATSGASDSSGSASSTPPDVITAGEFGRFISQASATTPNGLNSGSAVSMSDVGTGNNNQSSALITVEVAGQANRGGAVGSSAGGSASMTLVVEFTEATLLRENSIFVSGVNGGLTVTNSANQTVLSQSGTVTNLDLNFPADTYTFSMNLNQSLQAGNSASSTKIYEFKVVPEPSMAALAAGAMLLVHRKRRVKTK